MHHTFSSIAVALLLLALAGCQPSGPTSLPYLGDHERDEQTDSLIYARIPPFAFVDQDSAAVTNATFADGVYVADFFFTSCPTICPKVKKQMLRLHERYADVPQFSLLSHTIDVKYDTVGRLKQYAEGLGVTDKKWRFVTGEKEDIYGIAKNYMSVVIEDAEAPGGFDHSGWLLLVDRQGHIRSFCNGTEEKEVTAFMKDIDWLLAQGGQ